MRWLQLFAVGAALHGVACGDSANMGPACETDCPPAEGCESDCPVEKVSICGTDGAVGFIAIGGLAPGQESGTAPGLFSQPGFDVLFEIGSQYIGISPSCEFWFYVSVGPDGTPGGILRTGRFDEDQAAQVDDILKLESWEALGPVHGVGGLFDAPPSSFHWGSRTLAWIRTSNLEGPPPLPEGFPSDPPTLTLGVANFLSELGEPSDGPVRYIVVSVPEAGELFFMQAPTWPLEIPIKAVVATEDEIALARMNGLPMRANRAEGSDAVQLRAVRTAARNGELGNLDFANFIPIREPDGSKYILFVRDVASFESPEGDPERDPLAL